MTEQNRFSDEKLNEFFTKFEHHVNKYEERVKADDARFEALMASQNATLESVKGIVELHRDFQGAIRIGTSAQKVLVWLMKWGAIGVGLATIIKLIISYVTKHFP